MRMRSKTQRVACRVVKLVACCGDCVAVVYGSVDLPLLLRLCSFAWSEDVTGEKRGAVQKDLREMTAVKTSRTGFVPVDLHDDGDFKGAACASSRVELVAGTEYP